MVDGMKKGHFEMATVSGYVEAECWLYGRFAIHRDKRGEKWRVSLVSVGYAIPWAYPHTLSDARALCDAFSKAVDVNRIRRGKDIAAPIGLSNEMMRAGGKVLHDLGYHP